MIESMPSSVTSWLQVVLPLAIIALQAWKMYLDSIHQIVASKAMDRIEVQTNGGWTEAHREILELKMEVQALKATAQNVAALRLEELKGENR